jgi:hypothetical protein
MLPIEEAVMAISVVCPLCQTRIRAPEKSIGLKAKCPKCKGLIVLGATVEAFSHHRRLTVWLVPGVAVIGTLAAGLWGVETLRLRQARDLANESVIKEVESAKDLMSLRQWDKAIEILEVAIRTEKATMLDEARELLVQANIGKDQLEAAKLISTATSAIQSYDLATAKLNLRKCDGMFQCSKRDEALAILKDVERAESDQNAIQCLQSLSDSALTKLINYGELPDGVHFGIPALRQVYLATLRRNVAREQTRRNASRQHTEQERLAAARERIARIQRGEEDGDVVLTDDKGTVQAKGTYVRGVRTGVWIENATDSGASCYMVGHYRNGDKDGIWVTCDLRIPRTILSQEFKGNQLVGCLITYPSDDKQETAIIELSGNKPEGGYCWRLRSTNSSDNNQQTHSYSAYGRLVSINFGPPPPIAKARMEAEALRHANAAKSLAEVLVKRMTLYTLSLPVSARDMSRKATLIPLQQRDRFALAFDTVKDHLQKGNLLCAYLLAFSIFEDRVNAIYEVRKSALNESSNARRTIAHAPFGEKLKLLFAHGDIGELEKHDWLKHANLRNCRVHAAMWYFNEIQICDVQAIIDRAKQASNARKAQKRRLAKQERRSRERTIN